MSVINDADLKNKAEREYNNNKETYATTAVLGVSSGIFLTFGVFGLSGVLEFLPIAETPMAVPIFCIGLSVASALGAVFSYSNTIDENATIQQDIFSKYKGIEDDRNREIEKQKRIGRLIDIDNVKTPKQQNVLNIVKETDNNLNEYMKNKEMEARRAKRVSTNVTEDLETKNDFNNGQELQ